MPMDGIGKGISNPKHWGTMLESLKVNNVSMTRDQRNVCQKT